MEDRIKACLKCLSQRPTRTVDTDNFRHVEVIG
jgi:hypothetical protein